jgi:hypothetical protein
METVEIDIHNYLQILRDNRIFKSSQTPFLEYIVIYTDDSKVYKVLLHAYQSTLKKAKMKGINSLFTFYEKDNLAGSYKILSPKEYDISKGRFIIQFSFKTREFKIFAGEPTEEEAKQMMMNYFNKRRER